MLGSLLLRGKDRETTYYDGPVPTDDEYQRLLAFRTRLREFNHWSAEVAGEHGLTHAQHQLLLAIRGYAGGAGAPGGPGAAGGTVSGAGSGAAAGTGPTVGDVAEALLVRHHTAGELVSRAQGLGLVERVRDEEDHRRVRLRLTSRGHDVLTALTELHLEELRQLAAMLGEI